MCKHIHRYTHIGKKIRTKKSHKITNHLFIQMLAWVDTHSI